MCTANRNPWTQQKGVELFQLQMLGPLPSHKLTTSAFRKSQGCWADAVVTQDELPEALPSINVTMGDSTSG